MKHGIKLYDTLLGVMEGTVLRATAAPLARNGKENKNNMGKGEKKDQKKDQILSLSLQVEHQALGNSSLMVQMLR